MVGKESEALVKEMELIEEEMQQKKIHEHNKLRLYLILVTVLAILLTYLSRVLQNKDLVDIIG